MDTSFIYNWLVIWHWAVFAITVFSVVLILYNRFMLRLSSNVNRILVYSFVFIIATYFTLEPIFQYSDKWNYQNYFLEFANSLDKITYNDIGFYYYNKLVSIITHSSTIYFFITAICYVLGYVVFINKRILPQYRFLMFLMTISSLGFLSYGVNVIRAGLALSVFLIVLSRKFDWFIRIALLLLSILIHKSFLLPAAVYVFTHIYNRRDNFLPLWIISLIVSLVSGSFFVNIFGEYFSTVDTRVVDYTTSNIQNYKVGFRWDFILFSLVPIVLAFIYKKRRYNDKFFNHILSLYIITNSVWLLLIRMPFTDRIAGLSWFLIPFITLYPLLRKRMFARQHYWIAGVLLINALITFTLSFL